MVLDKYPCIQFAGLFDSRLDTIPWICKLYRRIFGNKKAEFFVQIDKNIEPNSAKIYFSFFLRNKFDSKIQTNVCILSDEGKIIQLDLVYLDYDTQIFFVINIEEPYDLKTNATRNAYDSDKHSTFLREILQHKFNIIRFTEEQIIRQPVDCITLIQEFILVLQGYRTSISRRTVNAVQPKAMWSEKDAELLRSVDYRQGYLDEFNQTSSIVEYI